MINIISDIIGMLGVVMLLVAYFFLQVGKIPANGYLYSVLNLVGSLFILFSLFYAWNWPAVVIEIAWAAISLGGIWQRWRRGSHIPPSTL